MQFYSCCINYWIFFCFDELLFLFNFFDYSSEMLNRLNSLRSEKIFTDATVCVGQEEFLCHRNVLAASSPYFRAMFTSELREGKETLVSFNDISPWIMKRIIDYIYTGITMTEKFFLSNADCCISKNLLTSERI
jgi:hypothetical protein